MTLKVGHGYFKQLFGYEFNLDTVFCIQFIQNLVGGIYFMGTLKDWWTYNPEKEEASLDSVHKPVTEDKLRSGNTLLVLGFTWGFFYFISI